MEDLKRMLAEIEADYVKFQTKGNKAAGTRVRVGSMEFIRKMAEFRRNVLNEAKNMKAKSNA